MTIEETFLSALDETGGFGRDVADYRDEVRHLGPRERAARFADFLSYLESVAATRGGNVRDGFDRSTRLLTAAQEGLERVRTIVSDLSAFSHPGSGEADAVDMNESVRRVLTILSPAVREKGLRVTRSLRLREPVRAVAGRLDQVVMNLLQNAVQASPEGEVIRVRTRRDGARGRLEVEDRGPGVPEDAKAHIFDPFFTTKRVGEGTGLGLAISYRIIEGFSGEIGFKGRRGRGTVFSVRLPLAGASSD